jgi:phosphoribosylpyrophosphate synthetase
MDVSAGATGWRRCISRLLGGAPTMVATVPSTRAVPRPGEHPLSRAVQRVEVLRPLYRSVLVRGPGPADHRLASDRAFVVTGDVRGHRILLVEDTFTSGARAQSAASALRLRGAAAVAVVPVGRVINPEHNENCRRIWAVAKDREFSFDVCCLCDLRPWAS